MAEQTQQVERYFDALIQSYNVLRDAAEKSRERGSAVYQELAADVANGQRETLELAKKVAAQPSDLGQNWSSILEATVKAQERSLSFAKIAYEQGAGAGDEARKALEQLVEQSRTAVDAAMELSRSFWGNNPMAEVWRRGAETFGTMTQQAGEQAKAAARRGEASAE